MIYLNEDLLEKRGLRNKTDITFYKTIDVVFPVKKYSDALAQLLREKKVGVQFKHKLVEIKAKQRIAVFEQQDTKRMVEVQFDALHIVPPHKPHSFIAESGLADAAGYVSVNKDTLQHTKYKNVWSMGDASNLPTSKTAAAMLA